MKNESIISDASQMAKHFNKHLWDIPKTTEKRIPLPKTTLNDYIKNPSANSFFINPVTTDEVKSHIKSLKNCKATGSNTIPNSIFKIFKKVLSIPLTDLINMSFRQGKFHRLLKWSLLFQYLRKVINWIIITTNLFLLYLMLAN